MCRAIWTVEQTVSLSLSFSLHFLSLPFRYYIYMTFGINGVYD